MSFELEKRHHLRLLADAQATGAADEAAAPLLRHLNARRDAYTTSSCAGRVQLLHLPSLGDKAGSTTLGRWHEAPSAEALAAAHAAAPEGEVWLFAQPPILHVEARTLAEARALLALGREAGFKNAAIRNLHGNGGALVELASTERLETPVRDAAHLAWLHSRALAVFARGREKLDRLTRLAEAAASPAQA